MGFCLLKSYLLTIYSFAGLCFCIWRKIKFKWYTYILVTQCNFYFLVFIWRAGWRLPRSRLPAVFVSIDTAYVEFYDAAVSKSAKCWQLFCWILTLPRTHGDHNLDTFILLICKEHTFLRKDITGCLKEKIVLPCHLKEKHIYKLFY